MIFDLSVKPENPVYRGLQIEEVAGRFNLVGSMDAAALNTIGNNIAKEVQAEKNMRGASNPLDLVLTGGAPIQVYLVAMHIVGHVFRSVSYRDGKGLECVVCSHG
jgi:hypothetical protein